MVQKLLNKSKWCYSPIWFNIDLPSVSPRYKVLRTRESLSPNLMNDTNKPLISQLSLIFGVKRNAYGTGSQAERESALGFFGKKQASK